jgi:PhzF family phenazine biosynthesis protein
LSEAAATIAYWHVDAFATRAFTGNQAAVMRLDVWLDDVWLQAIAAENNFAETAFLVPDQSGGADWELRWFAPESEVRLCGHATLASGHVVLGLEPEREAVCFRTRRAGLLEVRRRQQDYELALPAIGTAPGDFAAAVAALGVAPREVWRSPEGYNVFLYDSEVEIRALAPDMRALAALGDAQFIVTAPGAETDIVSRVFVPGAGTEEDSVTGSAHAVLTPFWTARLGRDHFTAFQASARGGYLSCRLDGDRAWLGGECVTVVEGKFFL